MRSCSPFFLLGVSLPFGKADATPRRRKAQGNAHQEERNRLGKFRYVRMSVDSHSWTLPTLKGLCYTMCAMSAGLCCVN